MCWNNPPTSSHKREHLATKGNKNSLVAFDYNIAITLLCFFRVVCQNSFCFYKLIADTNGNANFEAVPGSGKMLHHGSVGGGRLQFISMYDRD